MRKRIISSPEKASSTSDANWLDLETLAEVEITSEDAEYPIESALLSGLGPGWRAGKPGAQKIRLLFREPQALKRIYLEFVETNTARTQEYVLRWSPDGGQSYREVVRQQWNFNPDNASSEMEDLRVDLPAVTVLELDIIPDISGGNAIATLEQLQLA